MYAPKDNQSKAFRVNPEFEFGNEVLLTMDSVSDRDHHSAPSLGKGHGGGQEGTLGPN